MRTVIIILAAVALVACGGAPTVPDVVGLSADGARRQLEDQGFRVTHRDEVADDTPEGEVISQDPAAGQPIEAPTDRVTIAVAVPFETEITGTMTLRDTEFMDAGEPCAGTGGYSDLRAGAQVTVTNQAGEVIAVGRLGDGTARSISDLTDAAHCEFPLTIENVPEAEIYTIEVSHRGGLSYTFEDMETMGWTVALTLG